MPDFDSFATRVGIDAMLFRVIAMGRDLEPVVRKRLLDFRAAWRKAEVQNVARNSGRKGATTAAAAVPYQLCKLLDQPSVADWAEMSAYEADDVLRGPLCSPWACVLALSRLGAFDMASQDEA